MAPSLHFFYQKNEKTSETWRKMEPTAVRHFEFAEPHVRQISVRQLLDHPGWRWRHGIPYVYAHYGRRVAGRARGCYVARSSTQLVSGVLASNESLYPWMDEGFTDFSSQESEALLFGTEPAEAHAGSYASYFTLIRRGLQEPISQHSDHYNTNNAYGTAAYAMGTVFLQQLKYVIGEENFYRGMRQYYNTWKFKHPEPVDFIRVMEKVSGLQLKWYMSYFINTTKHVRLRHTQRGGRCRQRHPAEPGAHRRVSMPIDLMVTYKDGKKELFYIPMNEMLGGKPVEDKSIPRKQLSAWPGYTRYTPSRSGTPCQRSPLSRSTPATAWQISSAKITGSTCLLP